ncbi:hypothetical protein Nocox_27885 [Nonomuraea coxensis DSM 45129]|uniref:Uncharacterized protein n=1 Tax=Nonomuraea coxensis DSM 45129 TaxID=1122611 RepID=A0ABX8U8U7_9ACTN|nr:hypothetical protein [Nonomuraea coxensis]QYC43169.1 hypothetical protein Nocox_27885 [Nonomuraea coxensis DSM 45129]
MKARSLTFVAAFALATAIAPPVLLDHLGQGSPPLVDVEAWVQHVNVLTS